MKKIISLIIACAMLTASMVACADKDEESGSVKENMTVFANEDNTTGTEQETEDVSEEDIIACLTWESIYNGIKLTSYTGSYTEVKIPELINGQKVASLGNAFSGNMNITSISIPQYCTSYNLSGCDNLKTVEYLGTENIDSGKNGIPSSVESIIAPNSKIITIFHAPFKNLKYLDVPSAIAVTVNLTDETRGFMEEMNLNSNADYTVYTVSGNPKDILITSDKEEFVRWTNVHNFSQYIGELTENTDYILSAFGVNSMKINETEY